MRPLPNLDLARIAPLSRDQKRRELEKLRVGWPPYSYDPIRQSVLDILNIDVGPLAVVPRTPWSAIETDIRRRSRRRDETEANLRVAEGLYKFADENNIFGRKTEFFPITLGISEKVIFWSPAVIALGGRPLVPFIDPRRTKKLTEDARRFVFSVMHERIRVADPDFEDVGLVIIQFENSVEGMRYPKLHFDDNVQLIDFEMLDKLVRETYEIWQEIQEARNADNRRRGTGTRGPLI